MICREMDEDPETLGSVRRKGLRRENSCLVCNRDNTEIFGAYGGECCLSCRAFFRRATSTTLRSRNTQRFKRCLDIGMKMEMVLSGKKEALRYTKTCLRGKDPPCPRSPELEEKVLPLVPVLVSVIKHEPPSPVASPGPPRLSTSPLLAQGLNAEIHFIKELNLDLYMALESVSPFNQVFTPRTLASLSGRLDISLIFTVLQVHFVKVMILFLKMNDRFAACETEEQARILENRIIPLMIIMMGKSFEKDFKGTLRWTWLLNDRDKVSVCQTMETDRKVTLEHVLYVVGPSLSEILWSILRELSSLEMPQECFILIVFICLFTKDEAYQDAKEGNRIYFLKILFKYLKHLWGRERTSVALALLHKLLKQVMDFSRVLENIDVEHANC